MPANVGRSQRDQFLSLTQFSNYYRSESDCSHIFHRELVLSWTSEVPSCPSCNRTYMDLTEHPRSTAEIHEELPKEELPKQEPEAENCAICIDTMNSDEIQKKLDCSHLFHEVCVGEWLKTANTCPLCRQVVNLNGPQYRAPEMTIEEILAVPDTIRRAQAPNSNPISREMAEVARRLDAIQQAMLRHRSSNDQRQAAQMERVIMIQNLYRNILSIDLGVDARPISLALPQSVSHEVHANVMEASRQSQSALNLDFTTSSLPIVSAEEQLREINESSRLRRREFLLVAEESRRHNTMRAMFE